MYKTLFYLIPDITSLFIIASSVTPLISTAYLRETKSSQPHLLARPVVAPNSFPTLLIFSEISSEISLGNGPPPTLVV